jgi:CRP/FNR family transcriptional regulator, cyclic AMP receptor protein
MSHRPDLFASLDRNDKIWHLSRIALLEGLGKDELESLCEVLGDRVFPEGAVIFKAGDPAESLYFLNRGLVRLSIQPDETREKTVEILKGGDIFGLEAIGRENGYQVLAVAHEEAWVSVLRRGDFLALAREKPALSYNLIQILLQRLAQAHDDIRSLCFLDIQQRLIQALLKLGQKHGQRLAHQQNMVRLKLRLSHEYLARLTGANRPYLSNIMSNLRKKGWIRYQRNHLLIDVAALSDFAEILAEPHGAA